jgi:signal transduction histidine kinase
MPDQVRHDGYRTFYGIVNFVWVNGAYAAAGRHDPSFFPGKNHFDLYPHEENKLIFQRVVEAGEPFFITAKPFEYSSQPERGMTYWDWSLIPVKDAAGRVSDLVLTLAECTERIRAEEALRKAHDQLELRVKERTAELERKNRELQEFAYVASHDLSEPLRKIQTFGDLLKTKSEHRLSEQERDYVSRMTGSASRMQELLDALLKYSRVETQAHDFVPVKLEDIARTVVTDLEVSIKNTGAVVEIGSLPIIHGDPYQWRQVFQNLLGNALKYHRSEVKTAVKVYGVEKDGGYHIFVKDNGIGFDEKYLDKIFEPFQRLHGKHEYPGTGIGLAICRKIVERHGGKITATSTLGKGSVFIITMPQQQGKDHESPALIDAQRPF